MANKIFALISLFSALIFLQSCSSSKSDEVDETAEEVKTAKVKELKEAEANTILTTAESEQTNEMYSPEIDTTYLYWLDSAMIILDGSTKCNIFALNVLAKSGYQTPDENALSRDLFDTSKFKDVLPVVNINDLEGARKGDLVVWSYHVIIFESEVALNDRLYVKGWWAGTRQADNGDNIMNNVCHGKYKIDGEFVVRRPVKKKLQNEKIEN